MFFIFTYSFVAHSTICNLIQDSNVAVLEVYISLVQAVQATVNVLAVVFVLSVTLLFQFIIFSLTAPVILIQLQVDIVPLFLIEILFDIVTQFQFHNTPHNQLNLIILQLIHISLEGLAISQLTQ